MLDNMMLRWKLWRLDRSDAEISKRNSRTIAKARVSGVTGEALLRLENEESLDHSMNEDYRQWLHSNHLLRKAQLLNIAEPHWHPTSELWKHSQFEGRYVLTQKGIDDLKPRVRAEEKELRAEAKDRRDSILAWIAPLTGLVGSATGLLAIVTRCSG